MVTDNVGQFGSAVNALTEFNDPSLHHHFTVWLDAHLRKLKSHAGAVQALLRALELSGAKNMKYLASSGVCDVDKNIETAQIYLNKTLGEVYPWGM